MTSDRTRVAITGIGLVSPAGHDVAAVWRTLIEARSAAATITLFDPEPYKVKIACEVAEADPHGVLTSKEARRVDRVTALGLGSATAALTGAAPDGEGTLCERLEVDATRIGVIAGSGIGGIRTLEDEVTAVALDGPSRAGPMLVPRMMPNATAAMIAIHHGLLGPNLAVATACATGAHAIGEASWMIRSGRADVMVAGGTDACVSPVTMAAFTRMGALSRNTDPATASRPFDVDRDGFVMGEGAAFMVLEDADRARARNANVLGFVTGYGANSDAHHITAPLADGSGAQACIDAALRDAGMKPTDITQVNAHGTSTPHNDAAEAAALAGIFGAGGVPVTSTKGVTGHLIGAAGAFEAIAALLSARHGLVPPTANHHSCDLPVDVVSQTPRKVTPGPVLSTSFAFGGHNATLVLEPAL